MAIFKRRTVEISLFYGAKPHIHSKARELRKNMTHHEKIVWEILRRKEMGGHRFRRQHPIYRFVADFYCHKARIVIEIDGEHHRFQQREYDDGRTAELENFGIRVLRFANKQVEDNLDEVIIQIKEALNIDQ